MYFIHTLPNDEPMVIWATMKMEIAAIRNAIRNEYGDCFVEIHGGIGEEERHEGCG